ncbi:isocitrate lyase/PEP mutase family protein [Actinocorallia sp. B10E7]|uniref:isocitrate lyase/PEP mutase family protein n=1 Tax=Actinocorallia sp. B10E7 TaxID=3153558 RepID=UPI00325CB15E
MTPQLVTPADRLRARLAGGAPLLAAGCHDALSARLAAQAGFEAIHLSGALVSAVTFGLPDLGYVGATDMVEALGRVAAGTDLPIIADADTGYGDPLQVAETVRRYERAGAAALHLEDQVMPKRCGHMAGVRLAGLPETVARLRAAADARRRLVLIARTDALNAAGEDEALRRVAAFAEAGADAIFVEGARDSATVRRAHEAAGGLPVVVNYSAAGHAPEPIDELARAGARLALFPVAAALAGAAAMSAAYREILTGRRAPEPPLSWADFTTVLGLPGLAEEEERWRPAASDREESS